MVGKKWLMFAFAMLAVVMIAGCDGITIDDGSDQPPAVSPCPDGNCPNVNPNIRPIEEPQVNLPLDLRQWNWGGGSCVHASTVAIMRWQNQLEWADYWRKTYSGGESYDGLTSKLTRNNIPFAATHDGDVAFIDECCRQRLGAVIFFYPNHSISLVHMDAEKAMVLDNNRIDHFITIPRNEFIRAWKGYGGVAVVPLLGAPASPLPWLASS